MRHILFLASLLYCLSNNAQVFNTQNFLDPEFHSLSYSLKDSILLIGTESGVEYFTKSDTLHLKGQKAVMTKNGKEFYTLDKSDTGSCIRHYSKQAKLLDSIIITGKGLDLCNGKNSKWIYVLVGTDTKDNTGLSKVLKIKKGRFKSSFYTGLPASTSLNIAYSPKHILVGSVVQGAIFDRKGKPKYSFSTPQKAYVQSFGFGLFSVLHKQSDASAIEVFKKPGKTLFLLRHELEQNYPSHEKIATYKAIFECFDISQQTDYLLGLDHSNALNIFQPSGKPIEQITRNPACVFAFFLHDEVVAWYHSEKKKLIIVLPK